MNIKNLLFIILAFIGYFILLFILFIEDKNIFILFFTIIYFNLIFNIVFLLLKKFNLIINIYYFYNIIILKIPFLFIIFFYSYNQIQTYLFYRVVNISDLEKTSIYVLVFDLLLSFFILFFNKFSFMKIKLKPLIKIRKKFFIYANVFILLITAYLAKLYLIETGAWFFYKMNELNLKNIAYLSLANILEKLDILVLLFFVYKMKIKEIEFFDYFIFFSIIIISLFFAIISTSKGKVLTILFPMFLFFYYRNKISFLMAIIIFLPLLGVFFEKMIYYRLHPNSSFLEIINSHYNKSDSTNFIRDNKLLERINYQIVLARVLKTYPSFPAEYKFDYIDNLIGIIPRIIWSNKPVIGLNMNKIGYEIGFLSKYDNITYVGITPLGVSYYEMGYVGIIFISFFTAFLLVLVSKSLYDDNWINFILSIILAIQLARNGTYVNIIPSIIQIVIIFYLLSQLLNYYKFYQKNDK